MKTKSLSIFLFVLFVAGMNLGAAEDENENKEGEKFKYEKIGGEVPFSDVALSLKTILIGNSMVGKSALITKIYNNNFLEKYIPTVGFEFFYLNFKIVSDEDKPVLRYQIWDCSGQKNYRDLVKNFFQNARVFLLAYDVTNEESFKNIENWVNGVKLHKTEKHIHFVLIGNKIDLDNNRKITKEEGEKFAEENGMKFVEVSAKTGVGIKDLENILAKIIYEEFMKYKKEKEVEEEKKEEYDSESDFMMLEKPTHSSSLCDCCKKICENC